MTTSIKHEQCQHVDAVIS